MNPLSKWEVLENICLFTLIGFLVWFFNNGWWVLLILICNQKRDKK